MRVWLATTGAALLAAATPAAAAADAPPLALSSALGRLTLASSGGCTFGPIRSFCADPAAPSAIPGLPRLAVKPGAALTVKVDTSWIGRPAVALDDASRSLDVVAAGAGR